MKFPFKWTGFKEKIRPSFPYHYAMIVLTKEAKQEGVFDSYQKEIHRIKENKVIEKTKYSKADIESIKKVYSIPIIDMTAKNGDKDYEFDTLFSFGEVSLIK